MNACRVITDAEPSGPRESVNGYAPDLYTDGLAERLKARAGKPYRPSNGFEGDLFGGLWCARCVRDQAFRADYTEADGCEIVANTMALALSDPQYPREWQYSTRGQPICTAFEPIVPPAESSADDGAEGVHTGLHGLNP